MSKFVVVGSGPGKNLALNPSFELWAGSTPVYWASTINTPPSAQSFDAISGIYSWSITNNIVGFTSGYYTELGGLTSGKQYTISVYVKLVQKAGDSVMLRVSDGGSNTTNAQSATLSSPTQDFTRLTVTATAPVSGILRIALLVTKAAAGVDAIGLFDAMLIEEGSVATAYFDGDSRYASWDGARHLSSSYRTKQASGSGKIIDLATYGGRVLSVSGLGTPPQIPVTEQDAAGNVSRLDALTSPRGIGLTLLLPSTGLAGLQQLRRKYVDAFMSQAGEGPKLLRYVVDSSLTLDLPVYCEGGLEAPALGGIGAQHLEKAGVRLTAYSPYPAEPIQQLAGSGSGVSSFYPDMGITRDNNQIWASFISGLPAQPFQVEMHPDGSFWAAVATSSTVIDVYRSTGVTAVWEKKFSMGAGTAVNGNIKISPYGYIWAYGRNISSITPVGSGATAVVNLAYSKDQGATWIPLNLSSSSDFIIDILFIDKDAYVTGTTSSIGGTPVTSAHGLWKLADNGTGGYTPANFFSVSPNWFKPPTFLGTDNVSIYSEGSVNGVNNSKGFVSINLATKAITEASISSNFVGRLRGIAVDTKRGYIYAIGNDPTTFNEKVQRYTGSGSWVDLMSFTSSDDYRAYSVVYDSYNDVVWVGGAFTSITLNSVVYNYPALVGVQGNTIIDPKIVLPAPGTTPYNRTNSVQNIAAVGGRIYAVYKPNDASVRATAPALITCSVIRGNVNAYPIITIQGPVTLTSIENLSTNAALKFSGAVVASGETIEIDLRPGYERVWSSTRGDISSILHPSSNIRGFYLLASSTDASGNRTTGTTLLRTTISGTGSPTRISVRYFPTYWSFDG